jgi:Secretion system C-terminal sorting domain
MKKYLLSFLAIFFSCALFGQTILAPTIPCPTYTEIQFNTVSISGGNITRTLSLRITNDVSVNPKGVTVEILCDGINVTSTQCFLASTLVGGAIYTTSQFTCSSTASPLIRITSWTASNGSCQGSICGDVLQLTPISITGAVNCNPRSYTIFIDAKHEDPIGTPATISGTYNVYADVNNNGTIETGTDILITSAQPFSTTLGGALPGYTSRYSALNVPYTVTPNIYTASNLIVKATSTQVNVSGNEKLLANTCAPLPISLKNFNANQRNGKVALTWETDQENNNDGFEVQRRLGNGKYETIAFVDSKAIGGTGGSNSYSFDDNLSAANTVAYYRLRQVDLDGRSGFSEIRSIRNGSKQISVSVYPNPSRGTTNVSIPEGSGIMDISLNDLTGKSVQRWNSVNMRSLQLNNLKPGIYMLRIDFRETGDQIVERIVVQ